jgi:hypothetical protein
MRPKSRWFLFGALLGFACGPDPLGTPQSGSTADTPGAADASVSPDGAVNMPGPDTATSNPPDVASANKGYDVTK